MRLDSFAPPRALVSVVSTPTSIHRLRRLADQHPGPPLASFRDWNDARLWLDSVRPWREEADTLLGPLLTARDRLPDWTWDQILIFLLWRPLVGACRMAHRLTPNPDECDAEVIWIFLERLHRLDPAQRAHAYGRKLINDTTCALRAHYARERVHERHLQAPALVEEDGDPDEEPTEQGGDDPCLEAVENSCSADWVVARLVNLVNRGRLAEIDLQILTAGRTEDLSVREVAAQLGLTYEAAKKRRQRAIGILQRSQRKLSPPSRLAPLKEAGMVSTGRSGDD